MGILKDFCVGKNKSAWTNTHKIIFCEQNHEQNGILCVWNCCFVSAHKTTREIWAFHCKREWLFRSNSNNVFAMSVSSRFQPYSGVFDVAIIITTLYCSNNETPSIGRWATRKMTFLTICTFNHFNIWTKICIAISSTKHTNSQKSFTEVDGKNRARKMLEMWLFDHFQFVGIETYISSVTNETSALLIWIIP